MTEHFPKYQDVPLEQAPLGEVICQVRFSPIFRIATELPAELQEAILERFPEVHLADEADPHYYRFLSNDGGWSFRIAPDAFTLSTLRYSVWDDFGSYLAVIQEAMQKVYRISRYRRISLRYVNLFTSANAGGSSLAEVSQVLRPELVMPLQTQPLGNASELTTQLLLNESDGQLLMRVGARADLEDAGPAVYLDLDFHVEGRLPANTLVEQCKRYHDIIYSAFRWSLNTDKLDLFGPATERDAR